jgi:hypothetical protein
MWVAEGVRKYPNDFPANLTVFLEVIENGTRRVDVKVGNILYEFKSNATAPLYGFDNSQFIKDMGASEVENLNLIKWWFDGKKVTSLPKQQFLDQINGSSIDPDVIDKILYNLPVAQRTKSNLLQKISTDFDNIFQVR